MPVLYSNNAATTLAAGIASEATSLSVAAGTGAKFPVISGGNHFYATLSNAAETLQEIVKVTARTTDALTIVRAQDGTTALAWNIGDKIELRITKAMLDDLKSERTTPVDVSTSITAERSAVRTLTNATLDSANCKIGALSGIMKMTGGAPSVAIAADFPVLNQSTTGTAANVTGTVAVANGGTGATTASAALTNLGAAPLSSPVFTGNPTGPTPLQFDNDTSLATTAWVKGEGIQAANVTTVSSTPYTITDLQAGHIIYVTTGGSVVTLPNATAWPVGKALIIQSAVSATINRSGTQTIYCNSGGQTSISLSDGDSVTLYAVPGFNGWIAVGNSGQLGASSAFNHSIAANGYQKLPTKLIVQWGSVIVPVGAYPGYTGYFPISFPNGCLAMTVTHPGVATSVSTGGAISASQFVLTHSYSVSAVLYWIAIGY